MDTANIKMKFPKEGIVYDYFVEDGGLFTSKEEENAEDEEKVKKKVKTSLTFNLILLKNTRTKTFNWFQNNMFKKGCKSN